jgi:hypothetical protein
MGEVCLNVIGIWRYSFSQPMWIINNMEPEAGLALYSQRMKIKINFRDAKQYWGLEDFMNVKQTPVTNAANLSMLIVNMSHLLLDRYRSENPAFSVLGLKAHYRGYRYVTETIKMLPQKPKDNL